VLDGIVIAEIELDSETAVVEMPDWIGAEITGDPRYSKTNMLDASMRAMHLANSQSLGEAISSVSTAA
jgi:CYTH domain-containing protein